MTPRGAAPPVGARSVEGAQRQAAVVETRHAGLGIALAGFDMWCTTFGFSLFGTLKHGKSDARR